VAQLIDTNDLPSGKTSRTFEGYLHDAVNVSFFLSDSPPGSGPKLHTHPYEEVFIVQTGQLTFTVGERTIEARGGQIVTVPAGTPHKFVNSGTSNAMHVDIHVTPRMETTWLET
jgi:quercetin dioxygenase-like cupin family protein